MPDRNTGFNSIIILGPTASGKTRLAAQLAYETSSEIISIDSRQVYRDMNIGTGKDYQDYLVHGKKIPVHLIDITDAGSNYHIHLFMQDFSESFARIRLKEKIPVLCGGSAMYLDAVLKGYEFTSVPVDEGLRKELLLKSRDELLQLFLSQPPTAYTSIADISTSKRLIRAIEISRYLLSNTLAVQTKPTVVPLVFGLNPDRDLRRKRIEERLEQRLNEGLIDEVRMLSEKIAPMQLIRYGLEYKFIMMHLQGELSVAELKIQLTIAIQQFAKRQMTYFRKMEREGLKINWLDAGIDTKQQLQLIRNTMGI